MPKTGFSTGSLRRANVPFDERIQLYHSLGADAIELSFATPTELFGYRLSDQSKQNIEKFSAVSIHAPWKELRYNSDSKIQEIINKLKELSDQLPITGLVLHPDIIDDFKILEQSGLPFLLENMDRRKTYGTHPEHFNELKTKCDFRFVLDVEHAYEHDPSMKLAKEFVEVMGDRLNHMHVSGCSDSAGHVPTYCAINKKEITEILKLKLAVPIILEGAILEDVSNSISKELDYIRSFEN